MSWAWSGAMTRARAGALAMAGAMARVGAMAGAWVCGLGEDAEPTHCPYDVWLCGYAWGKYESLKEEIERLSLALRMEILKTIDLEAELDRLRARMASTTADGEED